jgi:hypothetical protein
VLDKVHSAYVESKPQIPRSPVYWEPDYIDNYKQFIRAFIAEYGNRLWVSYMRFGFGSGAEDYIQNDYNKPPFAAQWKSYGLSEAKWTEYSLALQTPYQV